MKNRELLVLILILLCFWAPVFMGAFDKDKPSSATSLRDSNPEILANWSALETAITQDHEFSTGGTNSGEHKQIKFNVPITTPTNAANKGWLYSKDVSSVVEAHWLDESGNELQFTSGGDLFSSAGLTVTGASTVAGTASVGGTLDVTGNIDPTTYETTNGGFLDEDDMASDAADKIASQQSIKAYADAAPAAQMTPTSYAAEESITFPNGLIMKIGTESVAGNTTDDVTYGTAFPTAFKHAQVSYQGPDTSVVDAATANPKSGSATSILQVTNGDNGTRIIYWMAIGY